MRKLKGAKASDLSVKDPRLTMLLFGDPKVGKSTCGLSFPNAFIFDVERITKVSAEHLSLAQENNSWISYPDSIDEILEDIRELMTNKHEYKTIVIDSLSAIYSDLILQKEKIVGSEFGRHISEANKDIKRLMSILFKIDMNVIIICHSKTKYAKGGGMVVEGMTFDVHEKLGYAVGTILEIQARGSKRVALVKGSWYKNSFLMGDSFDFSYDEIKKRFNSNRLELESEQIELADAGILHELNSLIELFSIAVDVQEKWLDKFKADKFEDMAKFDIESIIKSINDKFSRIKEVANV